MCLCKYAHGVLMSAGDSVEGAPPREWTVRVTDRQAGHGMSMPCYELPYNGWEMENPPTRVVERSAYDKLAESLREAVEAMTMASAIICRPNSMTDAELQLGRVEHYLENALASIKQKHGVGDE